MRVLLVGLLVGLFLMGCARAEPAATRAVPATVDVGATVAAVVEATVTYERRVEVRANARAELTRVAEAPPEEAPGATVAPTPVPVPEPTVVAAPVPTPLPRLEHMVVPTPLPTVAQVLVPEPSATLEPGPVALEALYNCLLSGSRGALFRAGMAAELERAGWSPEIAGSLVDGALGDPDFFANLLGMFGEAGPGFAPGFLGECDLRPRGLASDHREWESYEEGVALLDDLYSCLVDEEYREGFVSRIQVDGDDGGKSYARAWRVLTEFLLRDRDLFYDWYLSLFREQRVEVGRFPEFGEFQELDGCGVDPG